MNISPIDQLKLITLRNQSPYVIDNIVKYTYNIYKNVIKYSTCYSNFSSFNDPWDVFVLIFTKSKETEIKKYINKHYRYIIPMYCVVSDDYWIITNTVTKQIYEMSPLCTGESIGGLYLKEMGAVLAIPGTKIDKTYKFKNKPILYQVHKIDYRHIMPNNTGRISITTRYVLHFLIKTHIKDKLVIANVGAWLGRSTVEMLRASGMSKSMTIYSFDKFFNISETDYEFKKISPLDKFRFTVQHYETFCRNVSDYINKDKILYTCDVEFSHIIHTMRTNFIKPDIMVLESKIEQTKADKIKIDKFLDTLFKSFPNILVVGYCSDSDPIKNIIRTFHSKNKHIYLFIVSDCYILSGIHINSEGIHKYIKSELNKRYIENLVYSLLEGRYKDIIKMLKNKPININIPIEFCNSNTFYTLVVIEIYSKLRTSAKELHDFILHTITDTPKKIKNSLLLTYQDYIDEYHKGLPIIF